MANIHNTGLEPKPGPLLVLQALFGVKPCLASLKNETLLWKTFIEDHPNDIPGINRAGDRLSGMLLYHSRPLTVLARASQEEDSIRVFNDDLTNFFCEL